MASIPGIPVTDTIVPTDSGDTYPTHEDIYGRGGLMCLTGDETRTNIPTERLKLGMLVREGSTTYRVASLSPRTFTALPDEATVAAAVVTAQAAADTAQAAAAEAYDHADKGVVDAATAQNSADDALAAAGAAAADAAAAQAAADAATAAGSGFNLSNLLGRITSLATTPASAGSNSAKWYVFDVAGTFTGVSPNITVEVGGRLSSNGSSWDYHPPTPSYIPDGTLQEQKLAETSRQRWGQSENWVGYDWAVIDPTGKLGFGLRNDGILVANLGIAVGVANGLALTRETDGTLSLSLGSLPGILPVGDGAIGEEDAPESYSWGIVDSGSPARVWMYGSPDGAVHIPNLQVTEVENARGNLETLDARLSVSLDDQGLVISDTWGGGFLREARRRRYEIEEGDSTQLIVACIGDSWTHGRERYTRPIARRLIGELGNAGAGWCGFGQHDGGLYINGAADDAVAGVTFTGTWAGTSYYNSSPSPDIGGVQSSTGSSTAVVTLASGSATAVKLHYLAQAGGGSFRYKWGSGSWTTVSTAGSSYQILSLSSVPASTWTLTIEVVSGPVRLYGVDIQNSAAGARVHKLGGTGSSSYHWSHVTGSDWQTGLASLGPHLVTIMLGTNDQPGGDTETYRTQIATLITRIRTAVPAADILLIAACENLRGLSTPMSAFATEMRRLAGQYSCGFLDLQASFGVAPADYAYGSTRPLFASDLVHPSTLGGRAITAAIHRLLTT